MAHTRVTQVIRARARLDVDGDSSVQAEAVDIVGAMDSILERLWALANSDVSTALAIDLGGDPSFHQQGDRALYLKQELIAEAQALWRTLETLVATLRTQDLSVGDPAFTKLLACVRTVLSDPESWRVHAMDKHDKGVYVFVNRVLVKLGCRGERERDALTHDGVVELLLESMRDQSDSILAASSALQVLQTLAFDAKNRTALDTTGSLPFALALMKQHPRDAHVQVFGCKFLQLMVYDEACKEKLASSGAVFVALDALRRFPADAQVATSAVDLVYFLGMELESSAALSPTAEAQFGETMGSILGSVLRTMYAHNQVEQVQSNGIAILNTFARHPQMKHVICKGARDGGSSIWELVLGVLDCCCPSGYGGDDGCEAASDAVELLDALLSDPATLEATEYTLTAPSINDRTKSAYETTRAVKRKARCDGDSCVGAVLSVVCVLAARYRRSRRSELNSSRSRASIEPGTWLVDSRASSILSARESATATAATRTNRPSCPCIK